jgi:hypothetical protein
MSADSTPVEATDAYAVVSSYVVVPTAIVAMR